MLFTPLPLSKQWQLHEHYATDADLDGATFRDRRKLDEAHLSMVHEAGKSYRVLKRTFTKHSNDADYQPAVVREILERYPPQPVYTTVSEAEKVDKRCTHPGNDVIAIPITKRLDQKELAKVLLHLARWKMAHPEGTEPSPSSGPSHTSRLIGLVTNPLTAADAPP